MPLKGLSWPKKAKRLRRPPGAMARGGRGLAAVEAVLDHHELGAGQAPVGEAAEEEARGRDEGVDVGEEALQEELAAHQVGGADLGEADAAFRGRGLGAERAGAGLDHLAVVGADHQVLVQREDDRDVRQCAAGGAQRLDAEAHDVVEVDDVGPAVGEEALEMRRSGRRSRCCRDRTSRSRSTRTASRPGPGRATSGASRGGARRAGRRRRGSGRPSRPRP